jgi:hypothetical protein
MYGRIALEDGSSITRSGRPRRCHNRGIGFVLRDVRGRPAARHLAPCKARHLSERKWVRFARCPGPSCGTASCTVQGAPSRGSCTVQVALSAGSCTVQVALSAGSCTVQVALSGGLRGTLRPDRTSWNQTTWDPRKISPARIASLPSPAPPCTDPKKKRHTDGSAGHRLCGPAAPAGADFNSNP